MLIKNQNNNPDLHALLSAVKLIWMVRTDLQLTARPKMSRDIDPTLSPKHQPQDTQITLL